MSQNDSQSPIGGRTLERSKAYTAPALTRMTHAEAKEWLSHRVDGSDPEDRRLLTYLDGPSASENS